MFAGKRTAIATINHAARLLHKEMVCCADHQHPWLRSGVPHLFFDTEAFAIFSRSHFHLLDKCSTERLFVAKAGNA